MKFKVEVDIGIDNIPDELFDEFFTYIDFMWLHPDGTLLVKHVGADEPNAQFNLLEWVDELECLDREPELRADYENLFATCLEIVRSK